MNRGRQGQRGFERGVWVTNCSGLGYDVTLETRFAANFCFGCYIYCTKLAAANFLFIHQ